MMIRIACTKTERTLPLDGCPSKDYTGVTMRVVLKVCQEDGEQGP